MPSLTYGVAFGDAPEPLRVRLVVGERSSGEPAATELEPAELGLLGDDESASVQARSTCAGPLVPGSSAGLRCRPHDQVLRNQSVGSRWSGAGSGPRLVDRIRIRMSSASALAYSTSTSK